MRPTSTETTVWPGNTLLLGRGVVLCGIDVRAVVGVGGAARVCVGQPVLEERERILKVAARCMAIGRYSLLTRDTN
jgi:hypothetical protein